MAGRLADMGAKGIKADLLIQHATLLTMAPQPGNPLGILEDAALAAAGEAIVWIGQTEELKAAVDGSKAEVLDVRGQTVLPGFVDCHTHVIFGGSRRQEYLGRLAGESLESLKAQGVMTGIHGTAALTRAVADDQLYEASAQRLGRMLQSGTTTVESKSGYGLSLDGELRQLRIGQTLGEKLPLDLCLTFLGAHGWPEHASKQDYLEQVIKDMLPEVGRLKLASFCDVWCDEGYYTAAEAEIILTAGREHGLVPRIHTDAYSCIGGSDLAAEMRMSSADHLNYTPIQAAENLAKAGVIGVLLPGADFSVGHPRPVDARLLRDAGMTLALATNCNPGTWIESMQFVMMLACKRHGMTPAEAVQAATAGGAAALRLADRGRLQVGLLADIQVWNTPSYEDAVYRLGGNLVETVIKRGRIVHQLGPREAPH